MEQSVNRVELKGNVGQEPKIMRVENGGSVVRFSLATHETFKTKSGELKEETTWHNVVAWSVKGMPDFEKIRKGSLCYERIYPDYKNQEKHTSIKTFFHKSDFCFNSSIYCDYRL